MGLFPICNQMWADTPLSSHKKPKNMWSNVLEFSIKL